MSQTDIEKSLITKLLAIYEQILSYLSTNHCITHLSQKDIVNLEKKLIKGLNQWWIKNSGLGIVFNKKENFDWFSRLLALWKIYNK